MAVWNNELPAPYTEEDPIAALALERERRLQAIGTAIAVIALLTILFLVVRKVESAREKPTPTPTAAPAPSFVGRVFK